MLAVSVVPASPAHVGPIANRMRTADVAEVAAMGRTPKQALRLGLMSPGECWTALVNGRPEAMFGLHVTNALCGEGVPWMLGSEAIYDHPRLMLRHGRKVLARWLDSTPHLSNVVARSNDRAIRMLRRWGCEIKEGGDMFSGTEFVTFTLER